MNIIEAQMAIVKQQPWDNPIRALAACKHLAAIADPTHISQVCFVRVPPLATLHKPNQQPLSVSTYITYHRQGHEDQMVTIHMAKHGLRSKCPQFGRWSERL
jgi:hypothetical protein